MNDIIIEVQNLTKIFKTEAEDIMVLNNINFNLIRNEFITIEGPSGSGKSTFLHLIGTLEIPTEGKIILLGENVKKLNDNKISVLRNKSIGFIFQFHNLISELSALENVMIPLLVNKVNWEDAKKEAIDILKKVDLSKRLDHHPAQLSGGEKQRVAVARALVCKPSVILADEPTGNLDIKTGEKVLKLLIDVSKEYDSSLVIVTHNSIISEYSDKKMYLSEGNLEEIEEMPKL